MKPLASPRPNAASDVISQAAPPSGLWGATPLLARLIGGAIGDAPGIGKVMHGARAAEALPLWVRASVWVALLFAATGLLAVSARVQAPFYPVPVTLQTLAVALVGVAFGFRFGLLALLLYLGEGLLGLPVFASGAGPAYMAGPTGGYLAGFAVVAALLGWASDRGHGSNALLALLWMGLGQALILAMGFAWLAMLIGPEKAWVGGVAPFIIGSVAKAGIAAVAWRTMAGFARR